MHLHSKVEQNLPRTSVQLFLSKTFDKRKHLWLPVFMTGLEQ